MTNTTMSNSKRVVSYARVAMSGGTTTSVDRQIDTLAKYAEGRGWTVVEEIKDIDVSGSGTKVAPGVQRCLELAQRGEVDVVLVDQVSRWSRNAVRGQSSVAMLEEAGVEFVALDAAAATSTTQDPKELGRVFAHEKNMGGLDEHPNSSAYRASTGVLLFFAGREAGQLGLDDDDAMKFFQGTLAGITEVIAESK